MQGSGSLGIDVLGNGSGQLAGPDRLDGVSVGVIPEDRHAGRVIGSLQASHRHTIVVGNDEVDLVTKLGRPSAHRVGGGVGVPGGTVRTGHRLALELDDGDSFSANLDRAFLGDTRVGTAIPGSKCLADAFGTGFGIVMADIADAQHVADLSITVAVKLRQICRGKVIDNQLPLDSATTSGIEADIEGLVIPVHAGHVNRARGRVGWLSVEEHQRFVLILYDFRTPRRLRAALCEYCSAKHCHRANGYSKLFHLQSSLVITRNYLAFSPY